MSKRMKRLAPVHPGEILREDYMKPLNITPTALARALRMDAPAVLAIASGKRAISARTALRLARYFDTTPEFWLNLQARCELELADRECGSVIEAEVTPIAMAARAR